MFSYDGQLNISLNEQWMTGIFFLEELCVKAYVQPLSCFKYNVES